MITSSDFKLHMNTIALYGNQSCQRPLEEVREPIEAVVSQYVQACLTSDHWNRIIDGSLPGDELIREQATLQPGDRVCLHMYKNKIQISLPNERCARFKEDKESKYDLFREHIKPQLQQMIDKVSQISAYALERIYIQVELPIPQRLPDGDLRTSDLSPPTSSRLAARQERSARKAALRYQPSPPAHDMTFTGFVRGVISTLSVPFLAIPWRTTSGFPSEESC